MNHTSMQEIVTSFSAKYGLTQTDILVEIEAVLSAILSEWYRIEVMVFFQEDLQLEAVTYNNANGVTEQVLVDISKMIRAYPQKTS